MSAFCPPGHELTLLPTPPHGGRLLVWARQPVADAEATHRLVLGDEVRPVRAFEQPLSALLDPAGDTPAPLTLAHARQLVTLARRLVVRGSVRPSVLDEPLVRLRWRARPDADERAVLAAICQRWPAATWAPLDGEASGGAWSVARAAVDGLVDLLIRRAAPEPRLGGEGWEAQLERALCALDEDRPGRTANGPLARRLLAAWETAACDQQTPRFRLVLRLQPPAGDGDAFRLLFLLEAREGQTLLEAVEAAEVWADSPRAHLLADALEPARAFLRQALRKAGQELAAVEVSLASDAPGAALLSREDAWQLLGRGKAALEATGARVELPDGFDDLESRFPRARVRLERSDARPATEASLANRYRVVWEVHSQGRAIAADTLGALGALAPLARHDGAWLPVTREAADRLSRVAQRSDEEWTGPQALSAALAGEVRRAGDLADATVDFEPGLAALIEALGQEPALVPVPASVNATLRHYQQRGLSWLLHRARHGLGALLADDMGLGKTVQLISLLAALKEAGLDDGPTLVVCPASLVGNWERELGRFAPSLKVVRHHGAERLKQQALGVALGAHDVLLTTYGLTRRDASTFARVRWGTLVLDEAQNVKNPQSAQAKAVRTFDAARRVALSGTPVENRLSELWSLMEFLNPGLLGTHDRFRREISLPIERDRDARAVRWLHAATAPFLLRRLKRDPDIAPELPEKETIRVFCSLSEEQAKLYAEAVERSLGSLDDAGTKIERSGKVLKLLTELKQICNHPVHFLGDGGALSGRSGKLERAAEMLEEIVDAGERALVFTQYVEMASLLAGHLEKRLRREVPMFHGALTLPQREALVKRFQEEPDGPPVLVMSLRAGGVGLNLTRASHVMHYDRWWNPAVEDQASDRAHRIGQQRRVQVHLLVTMGTLEERIDRLLESKRGLADAVVSGGEAWLGSLSTDELRALVSLGSDATVESIEAWDDA